MVTLRFGSEEVEVEVKIKMRYVVEKEIDGAWVAMARLGTESDRLVPLCEALGGKIRVHDLKEQRYVLERVFE